MNNRDGHSGSGVLSARSQSDAGDGVRADAFGDECFAVAEQAAVAPRTSSVSARCTDTVLWGYRLIRQRPYYWQDKKKLLVRMMRTTNITLFKEHAPSFAAVVIPGSTQCWITCYGPLGVYLFDGTECARIGVVPGKEGGLQALGLVRYAQPQSPVTCGFGTGQTILMASSAIVAASPIAKIRHWLENAGNSPDQLQQRADTIVHEGLSHTGRPCAAIILKRPAA